MKKHILTLLSLFAVGSAMALESVSSGGDSAEVKLNMRLSVIENSLDSQVERLEKYLDGVKTCNRKGLLYGPEHVNKDSQGCVSAAEKDASAKNYAFDLDASNTTRPADRIGDLGMETCPAGEFVTSNGTGDVRCVPVAGGAIVAPTGSCAPTTITVGTCRYSIPSLANGGALKKTCEACDADAKTASLKTVRLICNDGVLSNIPQTDKLCDWSTRSGLCQFAPTCKPSAGTDCSGSATITKNGTSCQTGAKRLADGATDVFSCTTSNITLTQKFACNLGTFVSEGGATATAKCIGASVTLTNPNNGSEQCSVTMPEGAINTSKAETCEVSDGKKLAAQIRCNYTVAPEIDTKWRAAAVSVTEDGDSSCVAGTVTLRKNGKSCPAVHAGVANGGIAAVSCIANISNTWKEKFSATLSCANGTKSVSSVRGDQLAKCDDDFNNYSCDAGVSTSKNETSTEYTWMCRDTGTGVAVSCKESKDVAGKSCAAKNVSLRKNGSACVASVSALSDGQSKSISCTGGDPRGTITASARCDDGTIKTSNLTFTPASCTGSVTLNASGASCSANVGTMSLGSAKQVTCTDSSPAGTLKGTASCSAITGRLSVSGVTFEAGSDSIACPHKYIADPLPRDMACKGVVEGSNIVGLRKEVHGAKICEGGLCGPRAITDESCTINAKCTSSGWIAE